MFYHFFRGARVSTYLLTGTARQCPARQRDGQLDRQLLVKPAARVTQEHLDAVEDGYG